jgi:hypothetical protein
MKDNVRFDLSYNRRDADTSDDIMSLNINFDNPKSSEDVATRLQTFLDAAGYNNIYVEVQTAYANTPEAQGYYPTTNDDIPF